MDWKVAYRHGSNGLTANWTYGINRIDLLAFDDLQLEARFFRYVNNVASDFTAVSSATLPIGVVDHNNQLGIYLPTSDLRWQTVPDDFVVTDWTSSGTTPTQRRRGAYRMILDQDAGLSVVLGESARVAVGDVSYERATVCFALVTADNQAYDSTIDRVEMYVPDGGVWYSRVQLRIVGR